MIPIIILAAVFLLIAVRQIGNIKLQIWQVMAGGALIVTATGQIGIADAILAVDYEIMLFLFGMFFLGHSTHNPLRSRILDIPVGLETFKKGFFC